MSGYSSTTSGNVQGVTLTSGQSYQIYGGGTAENFTVLSGGNLTALSGGTLYNTVISNVNPSFVIVGGDVTVYSGGVASGSQIYAGGYQFLEEAGTAYGTTIYSGGEMLGDSGTAYGTTISSGGQQQVGGDQGVLNGGVASATTVSDGAVEDIDNGGVDYGTRVQSGGYELLGTGGTTNQLTIANGGTALLGGTDANIGNLTYTSGLETVTEVYSNGTETETYFSGGTQTAKFVSSGGSETVYSGTTLYATEVQSGNELYVTRYTASGNFTHSSVNYVYGAGSASGVTVQSGGTLVDAGAVVTGMSLLSGATIQVGGIAFIDLGTATYTVSVTNSAIGDVIGNGVREIVSGGGTVISSLINSGGMEILVSGGIASGTTVAAFGREYVSSGGIDNVITSDGPDGTVIIGSGGREQIVSGGVANGVIIRGGTQVAYSGGIASNTVVSSGGQQQVLSGGFASDTTILNGATFFYIGGTVSGLTVSSGGTVSIEGPSTIGTVTETGLTVSNGGTINVLHGGVAISALVNSGGREFIFTSGVNSAAIIMSGGGMSVQPGGTDISATLYGDAEEGVLSGGTASATTVNSGALLTILSGGVGISAVITNGGGESVYGIASNTMLIGPAKPFDTQTVYSGGIAINDFVESGGKVDAVGGVLSNLTFGSGNGGAAYVLSGGRTVGSILTSGAVEFVSAGSIAYNTVVSSGGALDLRSGTDSGTLVTTSGNLFVSAGGVSISATVNDPAKASGTNSATGGIFVFEGGTASGTIITSGGLIVSGGTAYNAAVGTSGVLLVENDNATVGESIGAQIRGAMFVSSGGYSLDSFISQVGGELVAAGGLATSTTISGPGELLVSGFSTYTAVRAAGSVEYVRALGSSTSATLTDGGVQIVSAGGTTIGTRVNAESEELVSAGATASATVVFAGGVLRSKGGTLINPVASGGDILDGPGDPTTGAEIYSGGVLIVETGGEAQDTTVNSGGTLVEAGGTVAGTQNSGGTVVSAALVIVGPKGVISTGSSTSSYSVTSGVTEYVFAGGTADATTIAAGGLLDLAGGTATGGIFFSGGGGTLEIDDVTPTAVISGFVAGDVIDLTGVAFVSGGSATLGGDDVLTVTEGGTNIQLNFDGSVTGDNFSVYADAAGTGTDVAPCYCAGTRIRTPAADIPVEHLAIGDLVQTLGGTAQPIKWIGKRSYAGAFAAVNPNLWPVLIRAGALSDNIPARDLYVSPEHAIYLDKRLIQARLLVNGSSIVVAKHAEVIEYYHIELAAHDVIYAEGAAAETFVDCDSRGMFHNAGEFSALYPGAAPKKWAFCAPMLERGQKLAAIQRRLLTRATKHGIAALQDGPLEGHLDGASGDVIHGWARMVAHPGVAVLLDVLNRGKAIGMVLANQFRADLADAGIGDGRHGFRLQLAKPLDPFEHHEISVRGALDGVELYNSPMIVEPAQAVGSDVIAALTRQVNGARTRTANPEQAEALLDMLLGQTEQVRQRHAELLNGAGPMRQRRGGTKTPVRRALVIDAVWPRPGQDAGSQAILAHMRGLKRLGWHVSLAVKACVRPAETALALLRAEGIVCHVPPAVFTVEEVLARQADSYQLVYLHRNSVARPYVSLIRDYQPHARIVYSVADLHHLRLARQASVEARPELMRHASWMKRHELAAIQQVDAVITHSPAEAALLAKEDTGTAGIHVVPWPVKPALKPRPAYGWDNRSGMVFVANFKHQPNLDGLNWLVSEVMPLVLGEAPEAILTVAGEGLPTSLAQLLAGPSVTLLGHVPDLAPIYNKARLAVAPLRFGAGLKGKVLEAWAHGLPCVMTLTAAEGLPLNGLLSETVARDAAAFARLIITLHTDQSHNAMLASLARQVVRRQFSQKRADAALAMAIAPPSYDNGVVIAWQDGSSKGSK